MRPMKRKPLTEEMLLDLQSMGDMEFCEKWDTSRQYPIRTRKRLGIKSFNNQHGTVEHKFENGLEYKWCQKEHWELVSKFGKNKTRWDGLRGWCKACESENRMYHYDKNDGAKRVRDWRKTERGKKLQSLIMIRSWRKRKPYYIKFEPNDEENIYRLCDNSCAYCKTPIAFENIEFDHFVPIKLGGYTETKNMLPACKNCNRGRGGKFDKDPYQWLMTKFGAFYGEQIYLRCVKILESL